MAGSTLAHAGQDLLHPIGVGVLCCCIAAIFIAPRKYLFLPIVLLIASFPSAQRIIIFTLDFNFLRIALLCAVVRIVIRSEFSNIRLIPVDRVLIYYVIWGIVAYGLLFGSFNALVTRTGYMLEIFCAYLVARVCVLNWVDLRRIGLAFGILSLPAAFLFYWEESTGRNLMHVFGGVPEFTLVREDRVRAQGPFSHPIMAGMFWSGCLAWIVAAKSLATNTAAISLFIGSILAIVVFTASSTPVMAVAVFLLGLWLFLFRSQIRTIQISVLVALMVLQIFMNAPVWHLISRINLTGGSTGWHRYHLIDQAVARVFEWGLLGVRSTAHWGTGLGDVTNQYILEGVRGGLLGMGLFIAFGWKLFSMVGTRIKEGANREVQWRYWLCGTALFVHAVSFLAVSYFGQMAAAFFFCCGATVSLAAIPRTETTLVTSYNKPTDVILLS